MKKYFIFTTKDIVEIAMLVAIAVALDLPFFKITIGANGGSISLSTLPLLILSYRKGIFKGFIGTGIVYGLLTCFIDGWGIQTYPFDYLLGFGSLSIVGLFSELVFPKKANTYTLKGIIFLIISIMLATFLRLCFAIISGNLFYELDLVGSFIYNITYILPSSGIILILLIILYKPILSVNRSFPR